MTKQKSIQFEEMYKFESVKNFKQLGMILNEKRTEKLEVKTRTVRGKQKYGSSRKLMKSKYVCR